RGSDARSRNNARNHGAILAAHAASHQSEFGFALAFVERDAAESEGRRPKIAAGFCSRRLDAAHQYAGGHRVERIQPCVGGHRTFRDGDSRAAFAPPIFSVVANLAADVFGACRLSLTACRSEKLATRPLRFLGELFESR